MNEKKQYPHLKMLTSFKSWDWRRENPVEVVILVFGLSLFFLLPRMGCGITPKSVAASNVDVMSRPEVTKIVVDPTLQPEKGAPKGQAPQG